MSSQAKAAPAAAARRTPTSSSSSASKRAVVSPAPAAVVPASPAPSPLAATQLLPVEAKDNSDLQSPQRMKQKLEGLAGRFDGFEDELNLSRHKKKADEDKRILILQTQLTNLQSSLALESKNRSMSVKALQNWLTDRIAQWTEQIEAPMTARLAALSEQITYLVGRIDGLEAKAKEDRDIFPKLVDGRCAELLREIGDLKCRFSENVAAREEKEKRLLLKLQSESNKSAVQFAHDRQIADEKIKIVRAEIDAEVALRSKAHDSVKTVLRDEVALLHAEIKKEVAERTAADEDLVQAINHYAAALQDGIKIVSTQ